VKLGEARRLCEARRKSCEGVGNGSEMEKEVWEGEDKEVESFSKRVSQLLASQVILERGRAQEG
jgi:hypothetical protein